MNAESPEARAPIVASGRVSVLVVDDCEDSAELLGALLETAGHRVRGAHDGASALELIERDRPNLVFLDVGLPGADGFEVAATMRARFGDTFRIVALTGYSGRSDEDRARRSGFDAFVAKPLQADQLEALLLGTDLGRAQRKMTSDLTTSMMEMDSGRPRLVGRSERWALK